MLSLDGAEDTRYTGWVFQPTAAGWGLASLLLVLGAVLTAIFPRARFRAVGLVVVGSLAVTCAVTGLLHSQSRRDIAPRLLLAVETLPVPADATPVGPIRLEHEGGFAYIGVLSMPSVVREWQYRDTTESGTCAALARDFVGSPWKRFHSVASPGSCEFYAREGYVTLWLEETSTPVLNGQSYFVQLMARPAGV
jgi:hypothetical protein